MFQYVSQQLTDAVLDSGQALRISVEVEQSTDVPDDVPDLFIALNLRQGEESAGLFVFLNRWGEVDPQEIEQAHPGCITSPGSEIQNLYLLSQASMV